MTSEVKFAHEHTSTWHLLAPALDLFVRRVNLDLYEREYRAIDSTVAASRRGFVNEIAFSIYSLSIESAPDSGWTNQLLEIASRTTRERLSRLENIAAEQIIEPSQAELEDCRQQVFRLRQFFRNRAQSNKIESRPKFSGAGILDSCEGDIYFDGSLFEVKAGQRPFKSVDFRQILTYAALNHSEQLRPINNIGLFNPRMGTSYYAPIDIVSMEISGCSSQELLREIIRIVSSGDVSR